MINSENIKFSKKPWPYLEIDNFLSEEHLVKLIEIAKKAPAGNDQTEFNYSAVKNNTVLRKSNVLDDSFLLELNKEYTHKILGCLKFFNSWKRLFFNFAEINLQVSGPNYSGPIHLDSPKKIATAIVYIYSKEPYVGTAIYNKNCDLESEQEINWKVNKAVIFSRTNYSHHTGLSNGTSKRVVLVFNLKTEKSGIVKNIDRVKDFFVKPFV